MQKFDYSIARAKYSGLVNTKCGHHYSQQTSRFAKTIKVSFSVSLNRPKVIKTVHRRIIANQDFIPIWIILNFFRRYEISIGLYLMLGDQKMSEIKQ